MTRIPGWRSLGVLVVSVLVVLPGLLWLPPHARTVRPGDPGPAGTVGFRPFLAPDRAGPTALGPSAGASFGEWPSYVHDTGRSGANLAERTIAPTNASGLRLLWSQGTGGAVQDTPIVDSGVVFASSWDGYEYAWNASNGSLKWKTFVGSTTFSGCGYAGARGTTSTATAENGTLYLGGGDARFYALNESTGSVDWAVSEKVNTPSAGDYNWGSPLVVGGTAYIGLATACGNPSSQGAVISINVNGSTHAVRHVFDVVANGTAGGSVWSTPSFDPATGLVWVSPGDEISATSGFFRSILALNASTLALVGFWKEGHAGVDYDFGAGPTMFSDASGTPLVGATNKNGVFYALNRSNVSASGTWRPVWQDNVSWYANFSTGEQACGCALAPAAFNGSTLFLGGGFARLANGTDVAGTVRAVDPSTGADRWVHASPGIVRAGVSYANGLLVDAADANDNRTATLEVLDAQNGTALYRDRVNGTINAGPAVADGRIFFGTANWSGKGGGRVFALGLPLNATATPDAATVPVGTVGTFRSAPSGGMPPYSLRWDWGDGSASGSGPSASHRFDHAGRVTVVLTVNDSGGGTLRATIPVNVTAQGIEIAAFFSAPASVVVGSNLTIATEASGGTGPLTYSYGGLPPGCASADSPEIACTPNSTGAFPVSVVVTDGFGDREEANTTVIVSPASILIEAFGASPDPVVLGSEVTFFAAVSGGAGPLDYDYSGLPSGCTTANASSFSCTPTSPGNATVQVTVADGFGDRAHGSAVLRILPIVVPPLAVRLFEVRPLNVSLGSPVTVLTVVTGGSGWIAFRYAGLPPGCDGGNQTEFTCEPTGTGTFVVRLNATDRAGDTVGATAFLNVTNGSAAPPTPASPSSGVSPETLLAGVGAAVVIGVAVGLLLGRAARRARGPTAPENGPR